MKRGLAVLLMLAGAAMARRSVEPLNTLIWVDTLTIDSTETEWTDVYWQDNGAEKTLVVEAWNDSGTGFASDSACVGITLYQVFHLPGANSVVRLGSRAHPDSSTYPFGSAAFSLFDSLDIADMDTTALISRTAVPQVSSRDDTVGYYYTNTFGSAATATGAWAYISFAPDFSPGLVLQVTGKASNGIRGAGSKWVFRWYQSGGAVTKTR
jgi:hypothetical protein